MNIPFFVDKYLKEPRRNTRGFEEFHPSEISSNCLLKLFYTKAKDEYEHDPDLLELFEEGHFIHKFCEDFLHWLSFSGVIQIQSIEKTRVFSVFGKPWMINGTHDAIVKEMDNGKLWVYDFKSIRSFNYSSANGLQQVQLPKPEHVTQINLYMYAYKIPNAKLIYVDKFSFASKFQNRSMDVREFEVQLDENLVRNKLLQIDEIFNCLKTQTVPAPISETQDHYECKYCSFKKQCKEKFNPFAAAL